MAGQVLMCQSASRLIQSGSALEARSLVLAVHGWITQTSRLVQRRHRDLLRHRTSGTSRRLHGALDRRTTSGARRTPALTRDRQRGTRASWPKTERRTARPSSIRSILWRWTAASGTPTARVDHRACLAGHSAQGATTSDNTGWRMGFVSSIQDYQTQSGFVMFIILCLLKRWAVKKYLLLLKICLNYRLLSEECIA